MEAARRAQVRLEREIAALRTIEALRIFAAAHDRKFPARLADIREVPVHANPATGKEFNYRLDDNTAILELPRSDGTYVSTRRFEIQIDPTSK